MKKFLIGLAAIALLSGTASAQTTTTTTDQKVTVKKHAPPVRAVIRLCLRSVTTVATAICPARTS